MYGKKLLWCVPVAGAIGAGVGVDRYLAAEAGAGKQDLRPAVNLPMSRVVLFNSGVGYFTRAGEVDGDARVDLTFQENDVNDLLKSMVLEDFNNGRISAVSYDSREPISRTLASFSIDLGVEDTTYDRILSQARGERVEVTMQPSAQNQPGKLTGAIVGLEERPIQAGKEPLKEVHLNLWCAEGLRSVKIAEIQQLRFLNPALESEIRRALEVLARNHDSQKKAVSLHFSGDGKRKVQVGYVVEAPLWKTSYRLMLDAKNKGKPYLQGWAIVENPTDEDWTGVKMALISGRPISFQMDLYNPLYVERPTVEPDLFASLRPPTYDGGFNNGRSDFTMSGGNNGIVGGFGGGMMGMGGMGMRGIGGGNFIGGQGGNGIVGAQNKPADRSKQQYEKKMDAAMARLDEATVAERKRYATQLGRELADGLQRGAVGSAATGGQLGDFFQYTIDH